MDKFPSDIRSAIMSKIRSKETKIEIEFRKALWHMGIRYRKNPKEWFWKPDILIQKYRIVIFLDSCFWHWCPEHFSLPKTRPDFWEEKIEQNRRRDLEVTEYYEKLWWRVFRFWGHSLKRDLRNCVLLVERYMNTH